ncbi:MAG: (E)-4-hydroxy-3-methylbut-2-enyl-diphosphate synthase [Candidatus Sumerlaeota bacterium]|nr:(E)-4-hydroxy-3-methylbut-2-enyl-diphosphate synthase [Candidatus Sumerlaeota bacterium]
MGLYTVILSPRPACARLHEPEAVQNSARNIGKAESPFCLSSPAPSLSTLTRVPLHTATARQGRDVWNFTEPFMMIQRRTTRQVKVGNVAIGGGAPVSVQTMTKTDTRNVEATLAQLHELAAAGADIVRLACPDEKAAEAFRPIMREAPLPIIADIHFDYRLALAVLDAGVDGIRLNPGNLARTDKLPEIVARCRERNVSIRVGVNNGSLSRRLRKLVFAGEMATHVAMAESALEHIRMIEDLDYGEIKISLKASDVDTTVRAYRELAPRCDYPFHVGLTEAGTVRTGTIKSSIAIGMLAHEGLCDTIRVSLTGDSREEVFVGHRILQFVGLRDAGPNLISCPSCGRVEIALERAAYAVEERLRAYSTENISVSVMGCVVNGPGEGQIADFGIAGGRGQGVIYRLGKVLKKCREEEMVDELFAAIDDWIAAGRPREEVDPEVYEQVLNARPGFEEARTEEV